MNLHSDVNKHFDCKLVIYVMIYVFRHLDNSSDKANKPLLTNRLLCCQPEQMRNMWTKQEENQTVIFFSRFIIIIESKLLMTSVHTEFNV